MTEAIESFFGWIQERHSIYLARAEGNPPPWTEDPILANYKFTNPFRENDRVTVWMRDNWTNLHDTRPPEEIVFNTCLFRMIGTIGFAEAHGWVTQWDGTHTKQLIKDRMADKLKTFTGAYIITNQGLKLPKAEVVCDYFLTPVWEARHDLAAMIRAQMSLQKAHTALSAFQGWGGGGFMAYEVVTDLNYTPVLGNAVDKYTWANAGPGAVRGLNRIHGRDLNKSLKQHQANNEMVELFTQCFEHFDQNETCIPVLDLDMRTIEHSLCEWDKYQRVLLDQGKPRGVFRAEAATDRLPVIGKVN